MFLGNADSVDYDDRDNYDDNYDAADDDEYRKIGSIRRLFKGFDSDYYKPIKTDDSFDGKRNSYIEYKTKGERYENLLPKEYFDMIRPYLRDLINDHKPLVKLTNQANNSDTERGEIWLMMQMILFINFLILFYKYFKKQQKHQMKGEANSFMKVLLHCIIIFRKET